MSIRAHEFNINPGDLGARFNIAGGSYELGAPVGYARRETTAQEMQNRLDAEGAAGVYRTSEEPIHYVEIPSSLAFAA